MQINYFGPNYFFLEMEASLGVLDLVRSVCVFLVGVLVEMFGGHFQIM